MQAVKINKPSTVYFKFFVIPETFELKDAKGKTYFYRYLPKAIKGNTVKVNIPDTGVYYANVNTEANIRPLSINRKVYNISLPDRERWRDRPFKVTYDPKEAKDSPAVIYTFNGDIYTGDKFKEASIPIRVFFLLHELGHFRYQTEKYCDLYATVEFIKMGYNPSTAMYALTDYLKDKPQNNERINFVFNKLKSVGLVK